jgi:HrpA-like RNA helicase
MGVTLLKVGALKYPDLPEASPDDYIYNFIKTKIQEKPDPENSFTSRILILEAGTGTGKSFTIPPLSAAVLKELGYPHESKQVICTQPKILTTVNIANRISGVPFYKKYGNLGLVFTLGDNLGYKTSTFTDVSPGIKVLFATNGSLDMEIAKNPAKKIMQKYGVIIIDEAHERSLQFDRTMMSIKYMFTDNPGDPDLPFVICMSATFDVNKYAAFFNCDMKNVIRVAGISNPIETRWPQSDVAQFVPEAVLKAKECIEAELLSTLARDYPKGVIPEVESDNRVLIFMTGIAVYKKVIKGLMKWDETKADVIRMFTDDDIETLVFNYTIGGKIVEIYLEVLPIESTAVGRSSKAYLRVTEGASEAKSHAKPDMRFSTQIIIANTVAETGLTLPDLGYVIDCGWSKNGEFNPRVNIGNLILTKPAAQAQILQRKGRVGREKPGIFIPLYTEATFNQLQKVQNPDIVAGDPTGVLLAYARLYNDLEIGEFIPGVGRTMKERMLDVPSHAAAEYSIRQLQMLGFLDNHGKITKSGNIAATITSITPQAIGMLMAGIAWEVCLDDLIAIAIVTPELNAMGNSAIWGYNSDERSKFEKIIAGNDKRAKFEAMEKLRINKPELKHWNEILSVIFNVPEHEKRDLYYKYRLICCDEFLDGLMVYSAFRIKFGKLKLEAASTNKNNSWIVGELTKWTSLAFINYEALVKIADAYVKTLNDLVTSSINVYANKENSIIRLQLSSGPPFMDTLSRIKKCIQHGYAFNMATLAPNGKYDVWWSHLDEKDEMREYSNNLSNSSKLQFSWNMFKDGIGNWSKMQAAYEYQPKTIIFRSITVQSYDPNENIYNLSINSVSVVSGF